MCRISLTGSPPNCKCPEAYALDDIHWTCRPWYISTTRTTTTYKPQARIQTCLPYQDGVYPDCHWRPCPSSALNSDDHEPNCRYNYVIFNSVHEFGMRKTSKLSSKYLSYFNF